MSSSTGYSTSGASPGPTSAGGTDENGYWDIGKLKKAYSDYLSIKASEIDEAKESRRYYHGAQWTPEQRAVFKKRKQDPATINRIARKIDGFVGALEKLRQDPKGYPRTPGQEQGADLATAAIRYVLDEQEWQSLSSEVARDGGIEGISGLEIELVDGDTNDPNDKDIGLNLVDSDSFFYDPRSYKPDFTDALYMGVGKWMTTDQAKELVPGKDGEIDSAVDGEGADLTSHPDRDQKWFSSDRKYIRVVECWYRHKGEWCWALFTGSNILMEGKSYLFDEKGKTICKYIMYSGNVDHDGDRYGFVRNMKSLQDGINFKESKLHHIMASNRLIMTQGAVDDIEKARNEWARPDGVIVKNPGAEIEADDRSFDFSGFFKLLEEAKGEIENFGINPAVIGEGVEKQSGRAISLLQQAGIAELGPYIVAYRGWKIRVYRAIFNALQRYWTAQRWIRVTDDDQVAQFVQINGVGIDPQTGMPTMVNALGSLDVDIIIDEGPDSINMMADTYDALLALAQSGASVPPQVLLELAPGIDSRTKKKITEMLAQQAQQPNPEVQKAQAQVQAKQMESQAQLQLKQQEAATDAELERQKAGLELQLRQAELEAETMAAERKARLEAETARQKAAAEIQLKREIAAAEIELEREKMAAQFGIEQQRSAEQMALERDKAGNQIEIERFKTKESANNERSKIEATQEAKREADKPKKADDARFEKLESMIAELNKRQARKLVRDKDGKIIGSEPVERLTA